MTASSGTTSGKPSAPLRYPHEEEEILPPKELIQQYQEKRASLNADIDRILAQITDILGIDITEEGGE